jgi:hypothetical protein
LTFLHRFPPKETPVFKPGRNLVSAESPQRGEADVVFAKDSLTVIAPSRNLYVPAFKQIKEP